MFLRVAVTKATQFDQLNWQRTLRSQVSIYSIGVKAWVVCERYTNNKNNNNKQQKQQNNGQEYPLRK